VSAGSGFVDEYVVSEGYATEATELAGLLSNDKLLYSDVKVCDDIVEFRVVVDSYMGKLQLNDVERVHADIAQSLWPVTAPGRDSRRQAVVRIQFPLSADAVSALPLPESYGEDVSGFQGDSAISGFKWLLDQHVLHRRVINLMEKGSDDRSIFTGPERLGKYFTGMRPLTSDIIHRGTCTSSSPTPGAFSAAVEAAKLIMAVEPGIETALLADMRARIQRLFCPDVGTLTFHPSGTDAESVPLLYAVLQSRAIAHRLEDGTQGKIVCRGKVVSIVTCAAEVGSGTLDAARGCYFSTETPLNVSGVGIGKKLPHLHKLANIEAVPFQARGEDGGRDPQMEDKILSFARSKLDADPTTVVVIHVVGGSKTGMFAPRWDVVSSLVAEYGSDRVVGVLDACQMRHSPTLIPRWLNEFGLVMITASKFYGGPSFAGGVLLSNQTIHRMQSALEAEGPGVQRVVAESLSAYLTSNEICTRMPALCGAFPKGEYANTGLVLRWVAGLYEMETLHAAIDAVGPDVAEERLRQWVQSVRAIVDGMGPQVDLLPMEDYPGTDYQLGGINSIVSLRVKNLLDGTYRDAEELKMLYGAMFKDVSASLPDSATEEDRWVAERRCLLGQPVPIPGNAVLRTCMGAHQLKRLLEAESFPDELALMLEEDRVVLRKLCLLSKHFDLLFPRAG